MTQPGGTKLKAKDGIEWITHKQSTYWDDGISWSLPHVSLIAHHSYRYPVFIDAAIQSLGVGFVGTDRSTMSMLARRRVESWTDGVVRIFKWGNPDSDNH